MLASALNYLIGTHIVFTLLFHIIEVVNHKYTIEHSHTEEGYKSHTCRNAERQSAQPQRQNSAYERQWHSREHHKRISDASEGKEQQQQDEHQRYRYHYHERADGVLQIFELSAVFEIIAGLEFHILIERFAYLLHHLLYVGIAHIHTYHYAALGGIAVYLQRSVHEVDGSHLAHRHLQTIASAHIQTIQVEVFHFLIVKTHHKVESALVFKHHSGCLAGISGANDVVEFLNIDAVARNLGAIIFHHQLRQTHSLLHYHIAGTGHLCHIGGGFLGTCIEFFHIFAIEFDSYIGFSSGHQLIETQLYRLTKVKFGSFHIIEGGFHLFHHLGSARCRSPFLKWHHHYHHIGIFYRHRVGGHFGCADFCHHMLHFGEFLLEHAFGIERNVDAARERTACGQGHLHRKVALIECRYKFGAQTHKKHQRCRQQGESTHQGNPHTPHTSCQCSAIHSG